MKKKYINLFSSIGICLFATSSLSLPPMTSQNNLLRQSAAVSWSLTDANQTITITNYTGRTKHYIISVDTSSNAIRVYNCNDKTISLKKSSSVNCSISTGSFVTIRNDGSATASGTYQEIG